MVALYPWLVAIPPLLLLGAILAPSQFANRRVRAVRKTVQALAIVAFVSSVAATFQLALFGTLDIALIKANGAGPFSLGVYFDSLAAVMSLLISFIGVVITHYSSRYLDGDPRQGRFFRWIAFTLGAAAAIPLGQDAAFTVRRGDEVQTWTLSLGFD